MRGGRSSCRLAGCILHPASCISILGTTLRRGFGTDAVTRGLGLGRQAAAQFSRANTSGAFLSPFRTGGRAGGPCSTLLPPRVCGLPTAHPPPAPAAPDLLHHPPGLTSKLNIGLHPSCTAGACIPAQSQELGAWSPVGPTPVSAACVVTHNLNPRGDASLPRERMLHCSAASRQPSPGRQPRGAPNSSAMPAAAIRGCCEWHRRSRSQCRGRCAGPSSYSYILPWPVSLARRYASRCRLLSHTSHQLFGPAACRS